MPLFKEKFKDMYDEEAGILKEGIVIKQTDYSSPLEKPTSDLNSYQESDNPETYRSDISGTRDERVMPEKEDISALDLSLLNGVVLTPESLKPQPKEDIDAIIAEISQESLKQIEEDEYKDDIRRLKNAKGDVAELKKSFNANKKLDKKMKTEKTSWKGSTYDKYKTKMDLIIDANDSYYEDTLDHVLDSLNNRITTLENKVNQENGTLGWIWSQINSLSNKIENFFN